MFSDRTNWDFSENKLSLRLKALKRQDASVIDLTESNPTRCNFKYLTDLDLLKPLSDVSNMNYHPSPKGKKEARQVIQSHYQEKGIPVEIERIFLTAGTSEAYHYMFRLLANAGDKILAPRPSYPLFQFIADLNDVELDSYRMKYENKLWRPDFSSVQIHPDTKAIILVHPNNPTGSFLKTDEAEQLIRLAKSHSLALISDEVFSDYAFEANPNRVNSFSNTKDLLTFTLGGISKSLGLPQMKLSWIVLNGPEKTAREACERLELIADTYLSVNTPVQEALSFWFSQKLKIQNEIKERIAANRSWLANRTCSESSVSCLKTEGGWYAVLKLPDSKNEEEWALEFLERNLVYVHPGYFFDFEEGNYIVVSLLPESAQFQKGCERILNRINKV